MGNLLALKLGEIEKTSNPDPLMARRPRRPPDTAATVPLGRAVELQYDGTTPRLAAVTNDSLSHTVTSDAAGNETAYFVSRTYSPRNLLERVTDSSGEELEPHSVGYAYDGRGLRVIRSESPVAGPGTTARRYYTYAPELRLLSVTADDAPNVWESHHTATEIVWFGDRPVAQLSPGAPTRYTFADHLGTPHPPDRPHRRRDLARRIRALRQRLRRPSRPPHRPAPPLPRPGTGHDLGRAGGELQRVQVV